MIQIVNKYVYFVENLKEYIDNSPYKTSFIYETLGMNKVNFYRKLRTLNFKPNEVLQISKILFPSEALLMELEKSNADKNAGSVVEHSEAMAMLRKKHL